MNKSFTPFLPAPKDGGFALADFWVWCGSVIRGEDGNYHLFAARWPKCYPMFAGYTFGSEIVRAVAATPTGPYRFQEVVLPARGETFWDGRMTHNPAIFRCGNEYLLYYIGSTYPGPAPAPEQAGEEASRQRSLQSWLNVRIGLAVAPSVFGPWQRFDQPILLPRPGQWDENNTTNPSPCVHPDGRVLLVYRSSSKAGGMHLGVAGADHFRGPYRRLLDGPIQFQADNVIEDPFVWHNGGQYEMLAKDCDGRLTGEKGAGVHASSPDGLHWQLSDPPLAYSRRIRWDDGSETVQGALERPWLLLENGRPTHFFAATGDGPGGFGHCTRTWNVAIPLAADGVSHP